MHMTSRLIISTFSIYLCKPMKTRLSYAFKLLFRLEQTLEKPSMKIFCLHTTIHARACSKNVLAF